MGLERPLFLLVFPIAALALWALVFREADGTASERSRRWFLAARIAVVALLVLSAAGPYTVQSQVTAGDPSVTLLVDESDSTAVTPNVADRIAESIESEGVSVRRVPVGTDDTSPIGDAVAANVPGSDAAVQEVREAVDEGYDALLENHAEAFEAVAAEFEDNAGAFEDLSADYLEALDEQIALLVEAHEDLEAQSVEAIEQAAEGFEELQAQLEDVQQQAAEAVEA